VEQLPFETEDLSKALMTASSSTGELSFRRVNRKIEDEFGSDGENQ
jgi:hypothetical protein